MAQKTDLKTERLPVLRSVLHFLFKMNHTNLRYDKSNTDTLKIIPKKMRLKTLFLSSNVTESMTVIPALPCELNKNCKSTHKMRYGITVKNKYN